MTNISWQGGVRPERNRKKHDGTYVSVRAFQWNYIDMLVFGSILMLYVFYSRSRGRFKYGGHHYN